MQADSVKQKYVHSMNEKYGVEYSMQSEDIKSRAIDTFQKKYGVSNPMQADSIKQKQVSSCIEHLGVEYSSQSSEVVAKIRKTWVAKNSKGNPINDLDVLEVLSRLKDRGLCNAIDLNLSDIYSQSTLFIAFVKELHDVKNRALAIKELSLVFAINAYTIRSRIKALNIMPYCKVRSVSSLEDNFTAFLDKNHIAYTQHNRIFYNKDTKGRLELDFILPDYNIAIEINDLGGHNIKKKDKAYHLHKSQLAQSKGIRLIHIWEWELTDEVLWNRLSRWLLNLLDQSKKAIDSNQCNVMALFEDKQKAFLDQYSLEGYIEADVAYGMYFQNELISLASFKKIDDSSINHYELVRLATRYGYTVDSYKPLLDSFVSDYKSCAIIANVNLDKHVGTIYEDLGFITKSIEPQLIESRNVYNSGIVKMGVDYFSLM